MVAAVVGHSHDPADSLDSALAGDKRGIRAVQVSLVALGVTAVLQLFVVLLSAPSRCSRTPSTTSRTR